MVLPDGTPVGIIPIADAISRAEGYGLDLVEVAPGADPPVCRIMNYGKFKYEKSKKQKEAKKKQHVMHLKEIKLHPKTDDHDFNFKLDHARKFLLKGDRVKATVVFRGREITRPEFGKEMLVRIDEGLADLATIEVSAKMEGRNMMSIYVPDKAKVKEVQRKLDLDKKREEIEGDDDEERKDIEDADDIGGGDYDGGNGFDDAGDADNDGNIALGNAD
ncbi:MAG: translation initiation factor IF-3 [Chitinispirillia bacterium]|nr:translation initiation factor IF-3 [Chitinispirillia bacterium]MCL2269185.1 translation initiation factor IF-3 [Chitinispirillia bacterium]